MRIRRIFDLNKNSQRSNISVASCVEQISLYISRSILRTKFHEKQNYLKIFCAAGRSIHPAPPGGFSIMLFS